MVSKSFLTVFAIAMCIALTSGQFFSANDGINLPRIGKRSRGGLAFYRRILSNSANGNTANSFPRRFSKLSGKRSESSDEAEINNNNNEAEDLLALSYLIEKLTAEARQAEANAENGKQNK